MIGYAPIHQRGTRRVHPINSGSADSSVSHSAGSLRHSFLREIISRRTASICHTFSRILSAGRSGESMSSSVRRRIDFRLFISSENSSSSSVSVYSGGATVLLGMQYRSSGVLTGREDQATSATVVTFVGVSALDTVAAFIEHQETSTAAPFTMIVLTAA